MSELDIEKLDSLDLTQPQSQADLASMINDVYKGSQPYLERLCYVWDQNIRFYEGEQHLYFNETSRRFEIIPITRYNKFIPRPVTNYILPMCQTMTSVFAKNKPIAYSTPNSQDEMDMSAAAIAERLIDAKWEMDDEQIKLMEAIKVNLLCGTVIRKDYWDMTKGPLVNVKDEMGNILYSGKAGDTAVEVIDPFSFIPDIVNEIYFMEATVKSLSWIRINYGKDGNGYTGKAKDVKEDKDLSIMLELQNRLRTSTGVMFGGFTPSSSGTQLKNSAIVKECYIAPTEKWPSGLMIVVGGQELLYFGPSPYYDPRYDDSWHPYTWWKWEEVFFRWHGLSLVESLVPLQRRINAIDSMIILNRMTMAMPQWMIPAGSGVPDGYISGEPGLCITATPVGSEGMLPQKLAGISLPPDTWNERNGCYDSMQKISRINEILAGDHPAGVPTAMGQSMLLEQSLAGLATQTIGMEKWIESGQTKKLRLMAARYKEPRPELVAKMQELNKDNLDVEIKAFLGVDLRDNTSIKIQTGSSLPKLKSAEQEMYQMLMKENMFGPLDPVSNPIGNQEFLELFGAKKITTQKNADAQRAMWVNSVLTAINRNQADSATYPALQDFEKTSETLDIYLKVLTDRMKNPSFKDEQGMFQQRYTELQQALMTLEQNLRLAQQADQGSPGNFGNTAPLPNTGGPGVNSAPILSQPSPGVALNPQH